VFPVPSKSTVAPGVVLAGLSLIAISCVVTDPADSTGNTGHGELTRGEAVQAITSPFAIDPRKSIIVTDSDIVSVFTLKDVLQQLVNQAAVPGLTPLVVFRQFLDDGRQKPSLGLGPHCDDAELPGATGSINGWPILCPRGQDEADHDPFADPPDDNSYMATTLSNRFDLAPVDGSDCGEYRIVFAKRSGITDGLNRNFIIFEARLPNPHPALGRQGCRPIVQFWQNLSLPDKAPATRASELHDFYFQGLAGFAPVIHIDHFGGSGAPHSGTIRTNEFLKFHATPLDAWSLRQFKLTHTGGATPTLVIVPTFVEDNPAAAVFDPTSSDPRAVSFQNQYFSDAVDRLSAAGDLNRIAYPEPIPGAAGAGESLMIPTQNNYLVSIGTAVSPLRTALQARLTAVGSTLTVDQLVGRAQSLSCAGCHEPVDRSNAPQTPLDVGLAAPVPGTLTFTQTSEQTEAVPDDASRTRFKLSGAVTNVFVPYRLQVMNDFLFHNPVLGIETPDAWTSPQASLSLHTGWVTEGITSLGITTPSGWNEVTSPSFGTAGLTPVGSSLLLDFFVSRQQPQPSWLGTLAVLISIPSAGIHNQWLGQSDLSGLPLGAFSTLSFALPPSVVSALDAAPVDVSLQIDLNVNGGSGPYFLDNVRFGN